jgi:hypothetical protein
MVGCWVSSVRVCSENTLCGLWALETLHDWTYGAELAW